MLRAFASRAQLRCAAAAARHTPIVRGRGLAIVSSTLKVGEVRTLPAEPRTMDGSRHCFKLRGERLVPGIVYGLDEDGKEERHLVQVKRNVLENELHAFGRAFESIIYDIEVDGVKTRVLPRCLQLHPLTNLPVSVNFLRYWDGCPRRKVKIPVTYYNQEKCLGIRRGGLLDAKMRDLDAWVSGPWIPPRLEVNLDGLRLGHKILAEHLELPEGVEPVRQKDLLSMISGKKSLMREEAKEQAEAEAAAA